MATQALGKDQLRIRMYRVGFGDCFLVSVPTRNGHDHILVDCGVHFRGDIKKMGEVIGDIAAVTNRKLAVVIASHAHQDHISGFGAFAKEWESFDVKEVWMPWLEDPGDKAAKKLRAKRLALAATLRAHFSAAPPPQDVEDLIVNATGVTSLGAAAAGGTNAAAMELLTSGFHGSAAVRYLRAGEELRNAGGIRGLTGHVLAPSEDESFLSRMDPPKAQRFLHLDGNTVRTAGKIDPFARNWYAKTREVRNLRLSSKDAKELHNAIDMPLSELAFALDKVLNNTSLVVAFRFGEQVLLFPGDAQWGNWQSWIDNGRDVLAGVTFYKVAHHGSHNATPKSALNAMTEKNFVAMASTQSAPWPSIPAPKLVKAIKLRTGNQYVQSDSVKVTGAGIPNRTAGVPRKFRKGALWIDYVT
jgi:beta-lactamase superfamily II metal-dependent hydrolase